MRCICLAMSKLWKEVVGSQNGYWKKACVQFGLPEDLIEEHIQHKKCCASPVTLFLAARRQRLNISGGGAIFARLERKAEECTSPAPVPKKRRVEAREYPTVSSASEKLWTTPCKHCSWVMGTLLKCVSSKNTWSPIPLALVVTLHFGCKSLWHTWEKSRL